MCIKKAFSLHLLVAVFSIATTISCGITSVHATGDSSAPYILDATPLQAFKEVAEEDILIFAIDLNKYNLSEGIILYQDQGRYFLSLSGLMDALEFPITIDVNKGTAEGWFLNDDRKFLLDLQQGRVTIENKTRALNPLKIHRLSDDLYVEVREISNWFPVLLEIDFQNLTIHVTSQEPLPIEERIAKEDRRGKLSNSSNPYTDYHSIQSDVPFFSKPYANTSIALDGKPFSEDPTAPPIKEQYSLSAAAIVMKHDAQINIFSNDLGQTPALRMTLGRKSEDREFLGVLRLREYSMGDVNTPSIALVSGDTPGRGFVLSTYELDRLSNSSRATLRGDLEASWEVELYRNGILLDFQSENENGQYEFTKIDTLPGLNVFKLIFYGPQGQKREEFRRFYSDRDVIDLGKSNFRIAVNQDGQNLVSQNTTEALGTDFGSLRLQTMGEYGLSRNFTLAGSFSSLSLNNIRREYYQAGLRSNIGGVSSSVNFALNGAGGYALDFQAKTSIDNLAFSVEHNRYYDYVSEVSNPTLFTGDISNSTRLTMNGYASIFQQGLIPFTLRSEYTENKNGGHNVSLYGRLSKYFGRFALTTESRWIKQDQTEANWDGAILTSTLIGNTRIRGVVNYHLKPHVEVASINFNSNWRLDRTIGMTMGMTYQNLNKDVASLSLGLNKNYDEVKLNAKIEADSTGNFYGGFGLSFGFGFDPRDEGFYLSSKPFANTGLISPRVFLDHDSNMVYSDGDELMKDVRFVSNHSTNSAKTDEKGNAFISGMPPYKTTYLEVNEGSLKNPYLISIKKGVSMKLRPGYAQWVDFPVQESGEIDGTIYHYNKGIKSPAQGIIIILKDMAGRHIEQQAAAYDGFYLIDRVPPGRYLLGFDNQQLEKLGYRHILDKTIQIVGENSIIYGLDYTLENVNYEDETLIKKPLLVENKTRKDDISPSVNMATPKPQYGLHLLSFLHARSIQPGWEAIQAVLPEILNERPFKLSSVENKEIYTRLLVGAYATRQEALADCSLILNKGQYCAVMLFEGENWSPARRRSHE